MPMKREKYPPNWNEIATAVKESAGWKCDLCGKQCRIGRLGKLETHKLTLTVAHINHVESDCRPENLAALCAPCHLRYDATRKAVQRAARRRMLRLANEPLFAESNQ
jgi:5-methylcytosine-specific restriction endonuclease McrA